MEFNKNAFFAFAAIAWILAVYLIYYYNEISTLLKSI